jgi:hypothetical protein
MGVQPSRLLAQREIIMQFSSILGTLALLHSVTTLAEVRDFPLSLQVTDEDKLEIDTGFGLLSIRGVDGNLISSRLTIDFPSDWREDEITEFTERYLDYALQTRGSRIELVMQLRDAGRNTTFWNDFFRDHDDNNDWPDIRLEVDMPASLSLEVHDGSGTMSISGIQADLEVEDGSGTLEIRDIGGNVYVDDGSGTLLVSNVTGTLEVIDGSGAMEISRIGGAVRIRDGSGNIVVEDVEGDLDIRDGSGRVVTRRIAGDVDID